MPIFKVVEGKLSDNYNHFRDYTFEHCTATDTRLMGVVALKVSWLARDGSKDRLIQLIHLDFSEYGIDDYQEIFTTAHDSHSSAEVKEEWRRISGSLGGKEVRIPFFVMISLIEEVLETNERYYRSHDLELQDFRRNTLRRIGMMRDAHEDMIRDGKHYSIADMIEMVCPKNLTAYETINYFIMRLVDQDVKAAAWLSEMKEEELSQLPPSHQGIQSLMRNRISVEKESSHKNGNSTYRCKALTMSTIGYHYYEFLIELNGHSLSRLRKVSSFEMIVSVRVSEFEAALQLKQPEYITVYKLQVPVDDFDLDESLMASESAMNPVPNGLLYVLYNKDNSHVNTSDYYLDHDLYGAYLLTQSDELVVMSRDLMKITVMEMDLASGFLMSKLELEGRYRFETQVFQTFCETSGAAFEDMIFHPEEDE